MKKENKKKILILSIIGVLLIGIAISFAYWQVILQQESTNIVTSDCFKLTFKDGEAINIPSAYPMSDEEGLKNTPYDFTITNICNSNASYQINLETLVPESKQLPEKYLKANLVEDETSKVTTKLLEHLKVEPTINGATDSYKLLTGILKPNEEKNYSLRLWMHNEVTASDVDSMNATYNGKVSVITSYVSGGMMMSTNHGSEKYPEGYFWDYKTNITKVVIEDKMNPKETELSWDISEAQDESVMSYLVSNEDESTYTLYLQANGKLIANSNSGALFYQFSKLEEIEGLELLDTSNVINMSYMFSGCSSLTNLDVSSFNTSNVTDMSNMFRSCSSLTNLDVSNLDTSHVTDMESMFKNCSSLTSLELSNFDTRFVIHKDQVFIDVADNVFIKVKSTKMQSWILNLSSDDRPSSWTTENVVVV